MYLVATPAVAEKISLLLFGFALSKEKQSLIVGCFPKALGRPQNHLCDFQQRKIGESGQSGFDVRVSQSSSLAFETSVNRLIGRSSLGAYHHGA